MLHIVVPNLINDGLSYYNIIISKINFDYKLTIYTEQISFVLIYKLLENFNKIKESLSYITIKYEYPNYIVLPVKYLYFSLDYDEERIIIQVSNEWSLQ